MQLKKKKKSYALIYIIVKFDLKHEPTVVA